MSRLLDDDEDDLPQRERELTLSTGAILAIFLGLVLLCGVFFGFGYNLGRRATTASNAALPATTTDTESAPTESSTFDNFKPSPSSPSAPAPSAPAASVTEPVAATTAAAAPVVVKPAPAPVRTAAAAPRPAAATPAATHATQPAAPAATPGGSFIVQIAAISAAHKDDADLLASALRGKGYDVAERSEPDNLIHIQVGPFGTKADAEAMRERLIVDGYNAIVK